METINKIKTFKEAMALSLNVPWKTESCGQDSCWCRMIAPAKTITYDDGIEDMYICGSGAINKEYAEHIVILHNEMVKDKFKDP